MSNGFESNLQFLEELDYVRYWLNVSELAEVVLIIILFASYLWLTIKSVPASIKYSYDKKHLSTPS